MAPKTPATAAAKPRDRNRRGSIAGCSVRSSTATNRTSSRPMATARRGPAGRSHRRAARRGTPRWRRRTRPGRGCPAASPRPRVAQAVRVEQQEHGGGGEERDRDGEVEHRAPAERADEHAAHERTDGRADRREQVEQAEGLAPTPRAAISRTIATELVDTRAPLTACRMRAPSRTVNEVESAASSDARPNARTPARNVVRWPNRSPSDPLTGRATATAPRYRVTTDATSPAVRPNSPIMPGRATASIVVFSGTRIAPHATPSVSAESVDFRRSSSGSSAGTSAVTACR